jgi:branched-chain amino acid transport system ATP-binding protein
VAGRVLVEGSPDEIAADPRVREIYLGRKRHG